MNDTPGITKTVITDAVFRSSQPWQTGSLIQNEDKTGFDGG